MDARGFAQNRASSSCMHVWHNRLKADEPAKLLSNNITALQYMYLLITTSRPQNPSRCVSYLVYTDGRLHNYPSSGSRFIIFHPVISSTPPPKKIKVTVFTFSFCPVICKERLFKAVEAGFEGDSHLLLFPNSRVELKAEIFVAPVQL